jgi:hypothetical protein
MAGEISPRIFLSASVPKPDRDPRFLEGPKEPRLMARIIETRVQDAVTSLVVEILRRGGQLAFGGHPAITPMVASAARNFEVKEEGARPILIYQSDKYRDETAPVGRKEMVDQGLAEVIWVPVGREKVRAELAKRQKEAPASWFEDPARFAQLCTGQAAPGAPPILVEALTLMRIFIFADSRPACTICMGGMEGVTGEFRIYREFLEEKDIAPERRIFALRSTYGATASLDQAGVGFYDREFFTGDARGQAGLVPERLEVSKNQADIEQQLLRRVRYERLMERLVEEVVSAGPLP